ncbi:MAG: NAD(P)H-hydrate dehydratase [Candidatus Muiribacteriota bacterium]
MKCQKFVFGNNDLKELEKLFFKKTGIPSIAIMENAASNCFNLIQKNYSNNNKILLLCGKGNNGGDGYALARNLNTAGYYVVIVQCGTPASQDCKINYNACLELDINIISIKKIKERELQEFNIIIDAVFGSNFRGKLPEELEKLFKKIRKNKNVSKIAIDVPSGLNLETGEVDENALEFDETYAIGGYKKGYFSQDAIKHCNKLKLIDIGIIPDDYNIDNEYKIFNEIGDNIPSRKNFHHKGMAGRVAVIGGSYKYHGAPLLTAQAALKSGAGLVYCIMPEEIKKVAFSRPSELIFKFRNKKNIEEIAPWINKNIDVVVMGPGSGIDSLTEEWEILFKKIKNKIIIVDADILKFITPDILKKSRQNKFVLTPHPGEFKKIVSNFNIKGSNIFKQFENFCFKHPELAIILKKPATFTSYKNKKNIVPYVCSALATGGTGDVLAGIAGGFLSQGKEVNTGLINAAVYIHVYTAAQLSLKKFTGSITPTDIISNMGDIIYECQKKVRKNCFRYLV